MPQDDNRVVLVPSVDDLNIKTSSKEAGDNLQDTADTTKSDLKEAAQDAKSDVSDAYHHAKEDVSDAYQEIQKVAKKTKEIDNDLKK